jgi:hypothetical protein
MVSFSKDVRLFAGGTTTWWLHQVFASAMTLDAPKAATSIQNRVFRPKFDQLLVV